MTDNQTEDTQPNVPSEAPAGPLPVKVGAVLREARERMGLSVDEVVNRIKLAPRQVEALEADDYAQLPEPAFVRGFVRSYARLVQLDPAPLLAALPHAPAESVPVEQRALTEVPFPTAYSARKPNIIWLAAALGVAVILLLFTFLHGGKSSAPTPPAASEVKVEMLEVPAGEVLSESAALPVSPSGVNAVAAQPPAAPVVAPKAPSQQEIKPSVEMPAPSLRIDTSTAPAKAAPGVAPAQRAEPPAVSAKSAPAGALPLRADTSAAKPAQKEPAAAPKSAGAIHMTFDDESWVEIKDKDGNILLSKINPRGSEQDVDGKAPFSLVIGNSAGVHLYYKGKQIDLASHTKVSTARLTLE